MLNIDLDQEFYLIIADYGHLGRAFSNSSLENATKAEALNDLVSMQVDNPVAVVYFNPAEGHSRDASEDMALEWLKKLEMPEGEPKAEDIPDFIWHHAKDSADKWLADMTWDWNFNR